MSKTSYVFILKKVLKKTVKSYSKASQSSGISIAF